MFNKWLQKRWIRSTKLSNKNVGMAGASMIFDPKFSDGLAAKRRSRSGAHTSTYANAIEKRYGRAGEAERVLNRASLP